MLHVLHRDANCLVIDKPAGRAVHPGPRTPDSLEDDLPDLAEGGRFVPAPVHRLDRDTSGCLLLARRRAALIAFNALWAARGVEKTYWAVVTGKVGGEAGVVDAALAKISSAARGWRMVVRGDGKAARTGWRVLARGDGAALVEFRPETGRTHQIRVHAGLLGEGCAVAGDPVYGDGVGGMALHARGLGVPALLGEAAFMVTAEPPEGFRAQMARFALTSG
ncbi:RluA family pseudouridine synthase [Sandaracinobacteroides saxicola]|uniref:RNA pseudouridine synthase n=1 Tax=Sandaracinobacteroides saxicola TaxID=2759707 RepID=A0A7G5ILX1_9SPHN|nr:RNA pseudouridine synthase [Sandaracinobacteroides saxicola]QMW24363.1 RNA pseudouridine synthase [Sandaracinobacteroides saxicola]